MKADGIDAELFEIARRSLYGKEIMSYSDIDDIANTMIACDFNGWNMFDVLDIYQSITLEEAQERLSHMMDEQYAALSVVKNK